MCLAPLDVWARLLLRPAVWIRPRYWLRLAWCLFVSALTTALVLPERLVLRLAFLLRLRRRDGLDHEPGVVVVLGYFRSGTTHLHYLLSCDPRFTTPSWFQALVPQGWWGSWTFLRVFLLPFLSNQRPMDGMGFGAGWPAEDDFAACNMGPVSSLPGRFIVPSRYGFYRRFHDLRELTPHERTRWEHVHAEFLWRMTLRPGGRSRRLLLKTPSHTARIDALLKFFGPGRVKFVHISRRPDTVVRSNVAMYARMHMFNLEPAPDDANLRRSIQEEYVATQRAYDEQAPHVPKGDLCEVRFEDLTADPIGELRRIYRELDLSWTPEFEERARLYLESVRNYEPQTSDRAPVAGATDPELNRIAQRFGHDRPAKPKVELHSAPRIHEALRPRRMHGLAGAALGAVLAAAAWVGIALLIHDRIDGAAWVLGLLVGGVGLRCAKLGWSGLGWWCAGVSLLTVLMVGAATTALVDLSHLSPMPALEFWNRYRHEMRQPSTIFWSLMGIVSAFRLGSRSLMTPGGRGALRRLRQSVPPRPVPSGVAAS